MEQFRSGTIRRWPAVALSTHSLQSPRFDVYREYPVYLGFLDHDRVVWTIANGKLRLWDSTWVGPSVLIFRQITRLEPDGSRVVIRNAAEIHGSTNRQP